MTEDQLTDGDTPPITHLNARQRRVLGVLVEKAYTTAEYYPLTLKAVTTGCNQKSNRDPVVQYSEDDVEDVLEELRQLGVVAVVHTESGRTERFRHYMRKRFTLTEPQLAVLTELLLRGRQQMGELRSRASRMVAIPGLNELREEVAGLIDAGLVQSGGPLERRGVEVDHNLYKSGEAAAFSAVSESPPQRSAATAPPSDSGELQALKDAIAALRTECREHLDELQVSIGRLESEVADLKRDLGA